jgi:4-hydroxybenzoate polyprenyltransferase
VAFDRDRGLRSIPARLGMRGSQWASRACHAAAFALLVASGMAEPRFGAAFAFAVVAVGGLLIYEHLVLARRGLAGLPVAFFTVNGVVSCVLGAAGVIDVWLV